MLTILLAYLEQFVVFWLRWIHAKTIFSGFTIVLGCMSNEDIKDVPSVYSVNGMKFCKFCKFSYPDDAFAVSKVVSLTTLMRQYLFSKRFWSGISNYAVKTKQAPQVLRTLVSWLLWQYCSLLLYWFVF